MSPTNKRAAYKREKVPNKVVYVQKKQYLCREKGDICMETSQVQTTFRITLPNADARFLKRLSANMGWQVVRMPVAYDQSVRKNEMTEDEFRTKLAHSKQQFEMGHIVTMQPDETADNFIQRLLCTQ